MVSRLGSVARAYLDVGGRILRGLGAALEVEDIDVKESYANAAGRDLEGPRCVIGLLGVSGLLNSVLVVFSVDEVGGLVS